MKSFRSRRALSPIFATLILIAIAVIAGIVVYMFTSGTIASLTGGGGAGAEKVAIQSASGTDTATGMDVTILAQSTGGPKPAITGLQIILKDAAGNTLGSAAAAGTDAALTATAWDNGALVSLTASITATLPAGTNVYSATLVTPAGGSFASPAFNVVVA